MKRPRAALPSLDHLPYTAYERVYEPAEDTFLLCDALAADARRLRAARPALLLELGPGTGAACTYLALLLAGAREAGGAEGGGAGDASGGGADAGGGLGARAGGRVPRLPTMTLAVDVNPAAAAATMSTRAANGLGAWRPARSGAPPPAAAPAGGDALPPAPGDAVVADLAGPLASRLAGAVDVLLFNPPYVPTPAEEVPPPRLPPSPAASAAGGARDGLAYATAGGERGRAVIDRALPLLPALLARPRGAAYVVLVEENAPGEVAAELARAGLVTAVVARVRAHNEALLVMRATWPEADAPLPQPT